MALVSTSLVSDTSADIKTNQLQIVLHGEGKTTASFATGTGTLVAGTPLVFDGTNYAKFTAAASKEMVAIVWPNDIALDGSANATGVVLLKGEVRKFSEIEALVETADKVALKASAKKAAKIGIMVRGIANINQA